MAHSDPDIFISYQRDSFHEAKRLREELSDEGWRVAVDEEIPVGAMWSDWINDNLEAAKAVVVIWTEAATRSDWVLKEARYARQQNKLFGVCIEKQQVPPEFQDIEVANLEDWEIASTPDTREWRNLIQSLLARVEPSDLTARRGGFDPEFLGEGCRTPLPAVRGTVDLFRYTHFSVVSNRVQRMAWYVAYNVDMAWSRDEGPTRVGLRLDPRVPEELQASDSAFRGSGYDRGHLACRRSIMWGDETDARVAGKQAHFLTNTAPQNPIVNRKTYLIVERWEMAYSREHGRLSVFCGPITDTTSQTFDELTVGVDGVRTIRNYPVPNAFWKIVMARSEEGRLIQAAFIFDNPPAQKRPSVIAPDYRAHLVPVQTLANQVPLIEFDEGLLNSSSIL